MKKDIHPKYYETKVTCGCGNKFTVGSTVEVLQIEICNACHPFYTGTSKLIDTAGRVDRFKARLGKKSDVEETPKVKKQDKKEDKDISTSLDVKENV